MSKIRTVKPELFRHEQLFEAEQKSGFPLRLIYIGLFTVVDAEGRFRWRPRQLKLDILPYDDINFSAVLSALAEFGFVNRYECDGECYGYIPSWRRHQNINQREPDSVLPDPRRCTTRHVPGMSMPTYSAPAACQDRLEPKADELLIDAPSSATRRQDTALPMQDNVAQMQNIALQSPASLEMEVEMELELELEEEVEREKEMEGKWKSKHPHPRAVPDPVMLVFEHWQRVMDHPKAVLDKQRRRFIQLALDKGYNVVDLCQAITGCSLTPHNRGQNDRGERYDGLHLILRSADQIDRFIRNAQHPPKLLNKAEQRLQSNVQAAQTWLQQAEQQEAVDGQGG